MTHFELLVAQSDALQHYSAIVQISAETGAVPDASQ